MTNPLHPPVAFKNPLLWAALLLYLLVAGFAMANHEMWADELHSWNIAKGSGSFLDIFRNTRYEGHPPLWYIILWTVARFTHDLAAVKLVHLLIAVAPVFLLLFYSRIPVASKLLVPFGYYFLFEYAILSRNYAIDICLAGLICVVMRRNFRFKKVLYYMLLLLLANTHLLGTLLAGSLHAYFLLRQKQQQTGVWIIAGHALLGIMVALPAVYFILPPEGSVLDAQPGGLDHLLIRAKSFMQAPLRSMLPVPAWWTYNWWNTQFLLEGKEGSGLIRMISLAAAVALPVLAFYIFRSEKKSLVLFFANFFFSMAVALTVLTLTASRYSGFIFVSFVLALWLYCEERSLTRWKKIAVNALLAVQVIAGLFAVVKDMQHPFSNSYRVQELVRQVPADKKLVCDYWAVNTYAPYVDKPVFCLDMQKEALYVLFDKELRHKLQLKNRYVEGLNFLNSTAGITDVYMLSTLPPELIAKIDPAIQLNLVDKREGAIEKFSNLYLYHVQSKF